ncbi:MAG: CYTH domain-containing protein [Ectothiorhodospiraceae bacterium]|nr:CYTH domain-containing protein [Chromatiales bacterium]MCP5153635.1 CYTH domain-containing protein [Ectothiorhodospiraceae bacterium]
MATEIERKFLVRDDRWQAAVTSRERLRQGYLANAERCSIRVRVSGDRAMLSIKSANPGLTRTEFEYPLPPADAARMLDELCLRPLIEKTRHIVEHAGQRWEVDVFDGDNAGLVLAEIELGDESEPFERPAWLGTEVSDDHRYYNANLVEHPYRSWPAREGS